MIFVIALNKKTRTLLVWRCSSVFEGRGVLDRLGRLFKNSLSNITLSDRSRDNILFNKKDYDNVKNFTYEQNSYWYIKR